MDRVHARPEPLLDTNVSLFGSERRVTEEGKYNLAPFVMFKYVRQGILDSEIKGVF